MRTVMNINGATLGTSYHKLNVSAHTFSVYNTEQREWVDVELPPIEWRITEVLLRNIGDLVTYRELTTIALGGEGRGGQSRVYWHITNLRKRIKENNGCQCNPIKSIPKFGYRWEKRHDHPTQ